MPDPVMIPTDMARDATRSPLLHRQEDGGRWTVLYDADCGFCSWSLARLLALDRARLLRPVALGSAEADELLADMRAEERAASWHLVAPGGQRLSAGAAAPPLLRLLPGGRIPGAVLGRVPALTEMGYRWVADHRSTLGTPISARAKERARLRIRGHAPRSS